MKDEKLTIAKWAGMNFVLPPQITAMPGPILLNAYQQDPLRWFVDEKHSAHCWGSQLGKDIMINLLIDYLVATSESKSTIQLCYSHGFLAKQKAKHYIWPMLEKYIPDDNMLYSRQVNAMNINIASSSSISSIATCSPQYLFRSEIDRFCLSNDFLYISEQKTYPFGKDARIFDVSSPTIKKGPIWRSFLKGCQYLFFVPCPHCGEFDHLEFENFEYPKCESNPGETNEKYLQEVEKFTVYRCPRCYKVITNYDKRKIVKNGKWGKTNPFGTLCSSRLPSWYAPHMSFGQVAREYIESKENPERMRYFRNLHCALPVETNL